MTEISQNAYCAIWMMGLEQTLWEFMNSEDDKEYGFITLTEDHRQRLKEFSNNQIWCELDRIILLSDFEFQQKEIKKMATNKKELDLLSPQTTDFSDLKIEELKEVGIKPGDLIPVRSGINFDAVILASIVLFAIVVASIGVVSYNLATIYQDTLDHQVKMVEAYNRASVEWAKRVGQ
jgi:hypothetical protein